MAYTNSQPTGSQLISNGQGTILGNFQAIDSGITGTGIGFSRNHVTMTDGVNGGLHNRVDFFQPLTSPSLTGFVGSGYVKNVTIVTPPSVTPELFFKNATSDTQITSSTLVPSLGQGMLPGGLQIRCSVAAASTPTPVVFSAPFPTACLSVVATSVSTGAQVNITAKSSTGFTAQEGGSPGGVINYYWVAVGY